MRFRSRATWRWLAGLDRGGRVALAAIVAVTVAGAAWRAQAIGGNTHVSADEHGYVANANRMLAHERYATFKWPPGTSAAFALATRTAGHRSLRLSARARGPAQWAQLAMGTATIALVAALGWALAGGWAALLAAALAASYEPLVLATRSFLSEPAGGLALVAAVAAGAYARGRAGRRREKAAIVAAGLVGAGACLTRGDLLVGMGVLAWGLACAGRPGWRVGAGRAATYLAALTLGLAPWVGYASSTEGRFVPITTAGPDAFFIGTYLPGKGALVPTEEALAGRVCKRFPKDCGPYWQRSAAPLFKLIQAEHPGSTPYQAVMKANVENVRRYMLGRPGDFAAMLWGKFWKMWSHVWSGGNSSRHPETSKVQHWIYLSVAWIGLLAGIALSAGRTRWTLAVSAGTLLAVAALATLFNDQPRYNVSLMPLLLVSGAAGLWLTGRALVSAVAARRR